MKVVLSTQVEKISTRADNTITIKLSTSELASEQAGILLGLRNKAMWTAMSDEYIDNEQVNILGKDKKTTAAKKTPSQRLRAVLYVLWDQQGSAGEFRDFYERQIEKIITHIKNKID